MPITDFNNITMVNVYIDLLVLLIFAVLHRQEVVDIGVNTISKNNAVCQKDYRIRSFLSIRHAHGDL